MFDSSMMDHLQCLNHLQCSNIYQKNIFINVGGVQRGSVLRYAPGLCPMTKRNRWEGYWNPAELPVIYPRPDSPVSELCVLPHYTGRTRQTERRRRCQTAERTDTAGCCDSGSCWGYKTFCQVMQRQARGKKVSWKNRLVGWIKARRFNVRDQVKLRKHPWSQNIRQKQLPPHERDIDRFMSLTVAQCWMKVSTPRVLQYRHLLSFANKSLTSALALW